MYFGSVRFFKHIILGTLVFAILVPTGLCIYYGIRSAQVEKENTLMQMELNRQRTETVFNSFRFVPFNGCYQSTRDCLSFLDRRFRVSAALPGSLL